MPRRIASISFSLRSAQKRFSERGIDQNDAKKTVLRPVRRLYRFPGKERECSKVYLFEKDFADEVRNSLVLLSQNFYTRQLLSYLRRIILDE